MDFLKLYVKSILPVGNGLKIQGGEIIGKGDRTIRETIGGRGHYLDAGHRPRYRGPGDLLWDRMERQDGPAAANVRWKDSVSI